MILYYDVGAHPDKEGLIVLVKKIMVVIVALAAAACETIEHQSVVRQDTGVTLVAGIGDTLLRVDHQKDLKNIFGRADVYGRKTDTGYSSLHYAGIEDNGDIVFYRKDSEIITNESTFSMSWNPFKTTNATTTGNLNGNVSSSGAVNANVSSQTTVTQTAPTPDYHVVIPEDSKPIVVPAGTDVFPIAGFMITLVEANKLMVRYQLDPINQPTSGE